jgi:acetyltransferase-like isoleucine patch superfamily enzyme
MIKELRVPFLNANEDEITLTDIFIENGTKISKKNCICVFESTKTSYEFFEESMDESYIYLFSNENKQKKVGSVFGIISDKELSKEEFIRQMEIHVSEIKTDTLIISNKAKEFMNEKNIKATDIKESGSITLAEAVIFFEKLNVNNEIIDSSEYDKLESIIKDNTEVEDLDFILKLKKSLNWIDSIYSKRWNRKIPIFDILFDRWQNSQKLNFGKNTNISPLSFVFGNVKIGDNTFVGPFTIIDGSGGLEIGNNCSIAAGVKIYSHDTVARALSGGNLNIEHSSTKIGNNCFIGPNTVITRGVKVSNQVYIGANSVILNDIPENSVVVGNPAQIVGIVIYENGKIKIKTNK